MDSFIVSVVKIVIHYTDGYALWYFTKKGIIYVLTLLSSWHCKYVVNTGVLCIFVTENCVDGIENRRSQLDLLYIEYIKPLFPTFRLYCSVGLLECIFIALLAL